MLSYSEMRADYAAQALGVDVETLDNGRPQKSYSPRNRLIRETAKHTLLTGTAIGMASVTLPGAALIAKKVMMQKEANLPHDQQHHQQLRGGAVDYVLPIALAVSGVCAAFKAVIHGRRRDAAKGLYNEISHLPRGQQIAHLVNVTEASQNTRHGARRAAAVREAYRR